MKKYFIIHLTASLLGIALLSTAYCQPIKSNINKIEFTFDSGGEYHSEGFGAWRIRLSDQKVTITHSIRGKILLKSQHNLSLLENNKLWALVENMDLPSLKSSAREKIPSEVTYTFFYKKNEKEYEISIWINDASKIKEIKEFVLFVKKLIQTKTGKEPVIE
ncbi:MAG: hypothetical protein ABIC68_06725 [Candidatus Omnitrophota bacterium]